MTTFLAGAEPGKLLRGRIGAAGDQLRFVVERAGFGIFDRDNAVIEAWERWANGAAVHSYPISTRPPANAKAGVIDVNIRSDNVTVGMVVEDAEKVAGVFSNIVSVEPLTREAKKGGEAERETVRARAIEEGAGAGFNVVVNPLRDALKGLEKGAKTVLVVGALGLAVFLVVQLKAGRSLIPGIGPT